MANFWDDASVINDCINIDNRVAIPNYLMKAVMAPLHRTHPGQIAMVDATQYLWSPNMHREIIDLSSPADHTPRMVRTLKHPNHSFLEHLGHSYPDQMKSSNWFLLARFDSKKRKLFILVAIDRFSKYPSAMITRNSGSEKIIKFLNNYIHQDSIPKNFRTDQFSGFKNVKLAELCQSKGINQVFCPVGDHRGCGFVERCIQTIKRN